MADHMSSEHLIGCVGMRTRPRRFIPAWAGNSSLRKHVMPAPTVHPRVGGEQGPDRQRVAFPFGSSPRGRGTAGAPPPDPPQRRFIPAWAGNRPPTPSTTCPTTVHPRVGGEQIHRNQLIAVSDGSSPRGRGTGAVDRVSASRGRFIPAWAGNRAAVTSSISWATVHPRVGGEQMNIVRQAHSEVGSSPRGRGTGVSGQVHQ